MSRWTHVICAPCWNEQHPDRPVETTVRIKEQYRSDEVCCFCGQITSAGIFVRAESGDDALSRQARRGGLNT